jgi:hypothetical protein
MRPFISCSLFVTIYFTFCYTDFDRSKYRRKMVHLQWSNKPYFLSAAVEHLHRFESKADNSVQGRPVHEQIAFKF